MWLCSGGMQAMCHGAHRSVPPVVCTIGTAVVYPRAKGCSSVRAETLQQALHVFAMLLMGSTVDGALRRMLVAAVRTP